MQGKLQIRQKPTQQPLFDRELLGRIQDIMGPRFSKVVEKYRNSGEEQIRRMRETLRYSDAKALRKAAHGLKGSSASLGAIYISRLCKELETEAGKESLENAGYHIKHIETGFRLTLSALEQMLRENDQGN